MRLIVALLILFALFAVVLSVPVRCTEVTINALEFDEDLLSLEEEFTLEEDTLKIIFKRKCFKKKGSIYRRYPKTVDCKDRDVCRYFCGDYVPGCKKTAYFADFYKAGTNQIQRDSIGYNYYIVCVKRIGGGIWMRDKTKAFANKVIKELHLDTKVKEVTKGPVRLFYGYEQSLYNVLERLKRSGNPILQYIGQLATLLMSIEKMCKKDPTWKKKLEKKIDLFVEGKESAVGRFSGNHNSKTNTKPVFQMLEMEKIPSSSKQFNQEFLEKRLSDDSQLCSCEDLFKNHAFKFAFPNSKSMALAQCKQLCK
eukprot:gene12323-5997_t